MSSQFFYPGFSTSGINFSYPSTNNNIILTPQKIKNPIPNMRTNNFAMINSARSVSPPQKPEFLLNKSASFIIDSQSNVNTSKKKLLVLDLDETLVCSSKDVPLPTSIPPFCIKYGVHQVNYFVYHRPFLSNFLQAMSKYFNLAIFTASNKQYANLVLNTIKEKNLISLVLTNEDCTKLNEYCYIKDLRKLGMALNDIIIIDNTPSVFTLQKDNGLPILSWRGDTNDTCLMMLTNILIFLSNVEDVRTFIPKFVFSEQINYNEALRITGAGSNTYNNRNSVQNSFKNLIHQRSNSLTNNKLASFNNIQLKGQTSLNYNLGIINNLPENKFQQNQVIYINDFSQQIPLSSSEINSFGKKGFQTNNFSIPINNKGNLNTNPYLINNLNSNNNWNTTFVLNSPQNEKNQNNPNYLFNANYGYNILSPQRKLVNYTGSEFVNSNGVANNYLNTGSPIYQNFLSPRRFY